MRSILRTVAATMALVSVRVVADDTSFNADTNTDGMDKDHARDGLTMRSPTEIGCYSGPAPGMVDMGIYSFQTPGWCQPLCIRLGKTYFAMLNGTNCFCGDTAPKSNLKVSSDNCQEPCAGYNPSTCGGINHWDVYNGQFHLGDSTGSQSVTVPAPTWTWSGAGSAATSSSATTTGPATVIVTQSSTSVPSSSSTPQASGPNTAAIAAGVVVAIVLVTAIIGGIFFFMRRKKQQALAEEQRRHEMLTSFVTAEKPGSGYTSPDSRLDPSLMFQRRLSDGSIRDNEDYSRRILKVANPDD